MEECTDPELGKIIEEVNVGLMDPPDDKEEDLILVDHVKHCPACREKWRVVIPLALIEKIANETDADGGDIEQFRARLEKILNEIYKELEAKGIKPYNVLAFRAELDRRYRIQ